MTRYMKTLFTFLFPTFFIVFAGCVNDNQGTETLDKEYPTALVNFDDYKKLVEEVELYREARLINLDSFMNLSREEGTIILDTRSKMRYDRKHLKGAKHLAFTEFTQSNLKQIIPDTTTRILIYCNNNFDGDQIDFASKIYLPTSNSDNELLPNQTPVMLALNIPTFINLYGYGYKNIYELNELVKVGDSRIEFEGTAVKRYENLQAVKFNKVSTQND